MTVHLSSLDYGWGLLVPVRADIASEIYLVPFRRIRVILCDTSVIPPFFFIGLSVFFICETEQEACSYQLFLSEALEVVISFICE